MTDRKAGSTGRISNGESLDWGELYILARIRQWFRCRIRPIKKSLVQGLYQDGSGVPIFLLVFAVLLSKQATLENYSESDKNTLSQSESLNAVPIRRPTQSNDGDSENNNTSNFIDQKKSNKVVDEIDLDNWSIICDREEIPPDAKIGVIYGRYSSDNQDLSGCKARIKSMLDKAEAEDIYILGSPLVDVAQSGKNYQRQEFQDFLKRVQIPDVDVAMVHTINRLGRRTAQSMYYLDVFHYDFDLTVITADGVIDYNKLEGLASSWVSSLSSEIENRNKARQTLSSQIDKVEEGEYFTWFKKAKIGYEQKPGDSLDVQVKENEIEVARLLFESVVESSMTSPWKDVKETLNNEYKDILYDKYGGDDNKEDWQLSTSWLKAMIRDPIYIGELEISGESIGDEGQRKVVERPDLQIIEEELFTKANNKTDQIHNKFSRTDDDILTKEKLLFEYGAVPTILSSDDITVRCDNCGNNMVIDTKGELPNSEYKSPIYVCSSCCEAEEESNNYKKFPNSREYFEIKLCKEILDNIEQYSKFIDVSNI